MNKFVLLLALLALAIGDAHAATTIALQRVVNDVTTSNYDTQKGTAGAAWVYDAYARAGERIEDSTTGTDYSSTSQETKCDTVDTATNSTTVYAGPALLSSVYVNTVLSAVTVVISDNATAKFTLPASLAAGTLLNFPGAQFRTTLVVDPDDLSTGNITVCYRPLDAGTTW